MTSHLDTNTKLFPAQNNRSPRLAPATRAVQAGLGSDTAHGAVVPPLYLSSNFTFAGFDDKRPYDYTRSGNPTRDQLADALASLEGGAGAVVTSSGMSAVHLPLQFLEPGDLLVAPFDGYGGTCRLLRALEKRGAIRLLFADLSNPDERDAVLSGQTGHGLPRMVWVETPSNPLLRITDLEAVSRLAHANDALVVADNTFLSPALQRPLEFGADLVVHSTTKYLNGHSDVVGGAVIAATEELHEQVAWWANCIGITGAPFDSYLTLRGVRTLDARLRVHLQNAAAIVDLLSGHPAIEKVYYPGLSDHPGHAVAARQQDGFGAMISFELRGGLDGVRAFLGGLERFLLAESLGGVESLIAHPATMTHAAMDPEDRRRAGIGDALLRFSVGIEDTRDLVRDVEAGLDRVLASARTERLCAALA